MRFAALFLVLTIADSAFAASTTAPAPAMRWEYASLLTSARLCKWTTGQIDLREEGTTGYKLLYAEMGGKKPPAEVSLIDLLNLAGEQGWELVAIDGGEGPHQYLFKRPVADKPPR